MRFYFVLYKSPSVLEMKVGHLSFSDQCQQLDGQNLFLPDKFPVHFQWKGHL